MVRSVVWYVGAKQSVVRLFCAGLVGVLLIEAEPARAQALPPEVRSAGVTAGEWQAVQAEVRRVARERDVSEAALRAVAVRVSGNLARNGRPDVERNALQEIVRCDEHARSVIVVAGVSRSDDL